MSLLWETCTQAELLAAQNALLASLSAKYLQQSLTYLLPAINPLEQAGFNQATK